MLRHYYRCTVCFSVGATDDYYDPKTIVCSICEGRIEYMGRVVQDKLVKDEQRVPCDARCTNAHGPHCDCKCGGANHGSHMVITVTRVVGSVPTLQFDTEINKNAAAIAAEFRQWFAMLESLWDAQFKALVEKRQNKQYLKPEEYQKLRAGNDIRFRLIPEIKNARQHESRMKKINYAMEQIGKAGL